MQRCPNSTFIISSSERFSTQLGKVTDSESKSEDFTENDISVFLIFRTADNRILQRLDMRPYIFIITILLTMHAGIALAERITVKVPTANIRSGPGLQHKILWKVEKYHPLEVIKKVGKWYYFKDFEGDKGWIYEDIVSKLPSVIVIKNKCNIRSGAGTRFEVVFTAEKGVPLKELGRKGDWIHIQHSDGDKGWIYKKLIW